MAHQRVVLELYDIIHPRNIPCVQLHRSLRATQRIYCGRGTEWAGRTDTRAALAICIDIGIRTVFYNTRVYRPIRDRCCTAIHTGTASKAFPSPFFYSPIALRRN